jgi:uncharacterized protein YbbC (DUF1343 family)
LNNMPSYKLSIIFTLAMFAGVHVYSQNLIPNSNKVKTKSDIQCGADVTPEYFPLLKGKRVGVVANQSSVIKNTHLVDSLLHAGIDVKKVFCPEHGFRGLVDAGKSVSNDKDEKTGLPIYSLYGKTKKPSAEMIQDLDVVLFDIQDVGVRFYTYLSTLHYVMEACAENNKLLIVLDRPNPNGYYIDGPMLESEFKSFLGLHPVPLVYGMTIGEYARMINGEKWLKDSVTCNLNVVVLRNYTHSDWYQVSINPSPNLVNMASIYLYPSLGLFEGTAVSVGRGTDYPFQVIGHPALKNTIPPGQSKGFTFVPQPRLGAMEPKYKGEVCYGYNLADYGLSYIKNSKKIYLFWLIETYKSTPDKSTFFDKNFNYHAGNATLQEQIKQGVSESDIHASWEKGIMQFKMVRKKYLLYPDFE